MRPAASLSAPFLGKSKPLLVIDLQHGLSNRLRALASAAVIAERSGRQLVVLWRTDAHCEARAGDLLKLDVPVVEDDLGDLFRHEAARVYNYMEVEPDARFGALVLTEGPGDIFVRSAYVLESPLSDMEAETAFLRGLRLSDAVVDLIRTELGPFDLALHIRMGTGPGFDHLPAESPQNWPEARHRELTAWRQASHVDRFIARVEALDQDGAAGRIFVAADLAETYDRLIARFGNRVRLLRRDLYDRSARQMQFALADLVLLTRAPLFLASTGSSFSDLAQRLARPGRRVEASGQDF